jgi:hypothetical protein
MKERETAMRKKADVPPRRGKSGKSLAWFTANEVVPRAPQHRRGAPIALDRTAVRVTGEALAPIWWRGRQWAVTEYGIEALDGTYAIAAERLAEKIREWSWLCQLGGKVWVDPEEFATAWLVALALHGTAVVVQGKTIPAAAIRKAVADAVIDAS